MPYRSAKTILAWTVGLLWVGIAIDVAMTILELVVVTAFPDFYKTNTTGPIPPGELAVAFTMMGLGALTFLVYIPTVIMFCIWIYRASTNARSLGALDMQYSAGWAVGSFFIPILNLFRPYQAAKEIEQASDPTAGPTDWHQITPSGRVGIWWTFWLISGFLGQISFRLAMNPDPAIAHASSYIGVASSIANIISAITAIRMMKHLHNLQEIKVRLQPAALQNHCIDCGYDLRGTLGIACPECGTLIPGREESDNFAPSNDNVYADAADPL